MARGSFSRDRATWHISKGCTPDSVSTNRQAHAASASSNGKQAFLTHGDLRKTTRIQAFMGFVGNALAEQRSLIEGASQN